MARRPTPTSTGTILLQPVASPVDTFVAPGPNRLEELAGALAPFNRELGTLFEARNAEKKEEALRLAEVDSLFANQDGEVEAVRRGLIAPQHSPTYLRRKKQLQGEMLGRRLQAGFLPAMERWEGKNSDDPEALDAFTMDYIRSNIGTDDPDVLYGAAPIVRDLAAGAMDAHGRYRTGQIRQETLTENLAAVNADMDDAAYEGTASGTGLDPVALGERIEQRRQVLIGSGGDPLEFDANIMAAVANKAVELQDPDLLTIFDRKVPGKDYTYGDTPDGTRLRQDALEKLGVIQRQAVIEGDKAAEKERKAQEDAATLSAIDAMREGGVVPEEVLAAGEKADPKFRTRVREWRDNLAKGERDPRLVRQIEAEIMAGKGMKAVLEHAPSLASPEDLAQVLTFAKSFEGARPSVDDVLGSTASKTIMDILGSRTKAAASFLDPVTGLTNEGLEAQHDFRTMMTQWAVSTPNASAMERDEAIGKASRVILDRLKPMEGNPGVSVYDRDPVAVGGFDNPYTDMGGAAASAGPQDSTGSALPPSMGGGAQTTGEAGSGDPAAEPGRPWYELRPPVAVERANELGAMVGRMPLTIEGTGLPQGIETQEQADYYDSFSPEERKTLEENATRLGKPLGAALDHLKGKGYQPKGAPATAPDAAPIGTPEAEGINPISFSPQSQASPPDLTFLATRAIAGAQRPDSFSGMRPEFASGVETMIREAPPEIAAGLQVMSGYRPPERQAELWKAALRKYGSPAAARKWVAPPGRSGHNHGHAADLAFNGKRLDQAPAEVREWVHENAGTFGLAFPLANEAWHVELAGARDGGSGEGRRTFSPQDAESFLNAAMALDPLDIPGSARDADGDGLPDGAFVPGDVAAGRLLDLIGQNESGGNYNAVFGNADATRDLKRYSIDAIIRQQTASKRRGAYSTAIGKYQFLRKTLVGLKEELGLTGEETFTEDLQDRLAVALLERRGYSAFKAGKLSRRQFARRLSQEWASVENPGTGRSYYAGDGFHGKAPTKTQQVYAALGFSA